MQPKYTAAEDVYCIIRKGVLYKRDHDAFLTAKLLMPAYVGAAVQLREFADSIWIAEWGPVYIVLCTKIHVLD